MKRYHIHLDNNIYNNLFKKGGASSSSGKETNSLYGNIDWNELGGDIDFNQLLGIDSYSTGSADSNDLDYSVLKQPSELRINSNPQIQQSNTSAIVPLLRSKSVGDIPVVNPILIKNYGNTHDEIEQNVEIILRKILQDEGIMVRIIPVTHDGSCGISSVMSLLTGKAPSSIEAYFKRRELDVESFDPSAVFATGCHGENIGSSELIEMVQDQLNMNLAVIHESSIRIAAELIDDAPFIFIIGDGNHYNAVEIDGNKILRIETQDYLYHQILNATVFATLDNEKILVPPIEE
jgi:hypothetical protein